METEAYDRIQGFDNTAIKDLLTGLYNRKFVDERLPVEIINASIYHIPLSVVLIDMDSDKSVTDTLGCAAGDAVLEKAAAVIARFIHKDKDWAARFECEKFLLCLPGTGYEEVAEIADKIQRQIEKGEFGPEGQTPEVSAALGVYTSGENTDSFGMEGVITYLNDRLDKVKGKEKNHG